MIASGKRLKAQEGHRQDLLPALALPQDDQEAHLRVLRVMGSCPLPGMHAQLLLRGDGQQRRRSLRSCPLPGLHAQLLLRGDGLLRRQAPQQLLELPPVYSGHGLLQLQAGILRRRQQPLQQLKMLMRIFINRTAMP